MLVVAVNYIIASTQQQQQQPELRWRWYKECHLQRKEVYDKRAAQPNSMALVAPAVRSAGS